MNSVFKTPLKLYTCLNKLSKNDQSNLIAAARYLNKEKLPLTEENLLYYSESTVFDSIVKNDKDCKSVSKKMNELIVEFYK